MQLKRLGKQLLWQLMHLEEIKLCERFYSRADRLHGQCFYNGLCEPIEEAKLRIIETEKFIDDVEKSL